MKRARSSYNNLRRKRNLNESTISKNESINYYKEIGIDNSNHLQKEAFSTMNKNYGINPNDYKSKYSIQLKRKNMYNELWNKSTKENKNLGLLDTIKVQSKYQKNHYNNIIGDIKGVVKKKRNVSAGTFCNIPIKGKENENKIKTYHKFNSSININSLTKNNVRNLSSKININSDLNTVTKSNSINIISNSKEKEKEKENNKNEHSIIFQNKEIQNCFLSPLGSEIHHHSVINNYTTKINHEETEKNDTDINKFLENNSKNIKNNIEKNSEILKLRTEYLIKFSRINDLFKKLTLFTDCFRVNLREIYNSSIKSLIRIFDICNNYLLNDLKIGDKIDEKLISSMFLNLYNLCLQNSKMQQLFSGEFHYLKNENLSLKQKLNLQENELNQRNKEINQINKLITKYDLNSKVKIGKKIEFNISKIKQKFTNQESSYVLTIYKLEEEIKNLTELLKKTKPELSNQDKMKEKVKLLNMQYEEEIGKLSRINIEKDMNLKLLLQRNSSLNDKISELENEITKLKNKEEKDQEINIYCKAKVDNLNKIIEKNNIIIDNLKRENEAYKKIKNKENITIRTSKLIFMSPK